MHAATESAADLSKLRVVCDWIQYKQNFRDPISVRRVEPWAIEAAHAAQAPEASDGVSYEIAIDLRRAKPADVECLRYELDGHNGPSPHLVLEEWRPGSKSLIWGFNALYWKALGLWEQATGRGYEQALPGGQSDARNVQAARELILQLFGVWDSLAARRALPEELYVLEIGVGNGNQARVWLDEFRKLDHERGREYYPRLHYLMGDYSPHVLELARQNVADHTEHISSLVLDALRPMESLGWLRYKAFLVYISNVYDNLPTDEIVRIGGHLYQVQVRAVFPSADAERIAAQIGAQPSELPELVSRLIRLGPELLAESARDHFSTTADAVGFWRSAWDALRLEERYVPLVELDRYEVAPDVNGELLRPIVMANGDLRMHVSNGAAASFAATLPLLHPHGVLQCHDLFVTDVHQYLNGFRGPGKYDGSVVNWVNGTLIAAIGSRRGFDVKFEAFAYRTGANVLTMTARARD